LAGKKFKTRIENTIDLFIYQLKNYFSGSDKYKSESLTHLLMKGFDAVYSFLGQKLLKFVFFVHFLLKRNDGMEIN